MKVKVTPENIIEYGLDVLTGNTAADLLARAKELEKDGYELYVRIPDVEGGDNDAPTERNIFDHFGPGLPDPEGFTHKQETLDLREQGYTEDPCSYRGDTQIDGSTVWVCVKHGVTSKYSVEAASHAPCLAVDPYEREF